MALFGTLCFTIWQRCLWNGRSTRPFEGYSMGTRPILIEFERISDGFGMKQTRQKKDGSRIHEFHPMRRCEAKLEKGLRTNRLNAHLVFPSKTDEHIDRRRNRTPFVPTPSSWTKTFPLQEDSWDGKDAYPSVTSGKDFLELSFYPFIHPSCTCICDGSIDVAFVTSLLRGGSLLQRMRIGKKKGGYHS